MDKTPIPKWVQLCNIICLIYVLFLLIDVNAPTSGYPTLYSAVAKDIRKPGLLEFVFKSKSIVQAEEHQRAFSERTVHFVTVDL